MKTYWRVEVLNIATRWRWVVNFTHRPLYPRGKRPRYPLDTRLDDPHSWSGRGGEEKNSHFCPSREMNRGHPTRSVVSILTELPRLPLTVSNIWLYNELSTAFYMLSIGLHCTRSAVHTGRERLTSLSCSQSLQCSLLWPHYVRQTCNKNNAHWNPQANSSCNCRSN
jgi:hypothetical protein